MSKENNQEKTVINRREMLTLMGTSVLTLAAGSALLNQAFPIAGAAELEKSTSTPMEPEALAEPPAVSSPPPAINVYNVRDYGAAGDGLQDDTAAIQSALTLASTAGGVTSIVYLPKGTYKVTDTLRIYAHTYLKLDKGTTMVRHHDRSFLINGDWHANYTGYDGQGHIVIEGGVWEGNIHQYPNDYNCFGLARARNLIIRDLEVRDVVTAHAIDMNACEDVRIENCRFLGYRDGTFDQSRNYAEAIQLANHTATGFSDMGGHDGTPCRNISIVNCYFGASGTAGTTAWPAGVGNHYAVHNLYNANITIEGNTFDGMTYAGVRSFKFADLKVINNSFYSCLRGVQLSNPAANTESSKDSNGVQSGLPQSSYSILVQGNSFTDTLTEPIYCVGWPNSNTVYAKVLDVTISNNVFNSNRGNQAAIFMKWVDGVEITSNQFRDVYRGIYMAYASNSTISHNLMQQVTTEGVFVEEPDTAYGGNGHTANLNVSSNTIRRSGRTAINIRAARGFHITQNLIEAPAFETDNTRHGIQTSSGASYGKISSNIVIPASSGNKNQYGIHVTSTCSYVQTSDNQAQGKSKAVVVEGGTNFDGLYMHSANGTRYQVTVNNAGNLVFTTTS